MSLLLDTHVLLWYLLGDRRRIGRELQSRIESEGAIVSIVSVWEAAIKSALGKLDVTADPAFEAYGVKVVRAGA